MKSAVWAGLHARNDLISSEGGQARQGQVCACVQIYHTADTTQIQTEGGGNTAKRRSIVLLAWAAGYVVGVEGGVRVVH
jgi:hypothetical protein